MTGSRYQHLAERMDDRRLELGLSWKEVAAAADISEATLRAIRNGTNEPSPLTRRGIDRAMQWMPGSVDRVLNGGEPTAIGPHVRAHDAHMTTPAPALDVPTDEELRASGLQPETVEALLDMRRHVERLVAKRDEDAIRRANRVLRALDEGQDAG